MPALEVKALQVKVEKEKSPPIGGDFSFSFSQNGDIKGIYCLTSKSNESQKPLP